MGPYATRVAHRIKRQAEQSGLFFGSLAPERLDCLLLLRIVLERHMVDVTISVFKDAAEALDKLVDTISKLAGLFRDAVKTGSELVDWAHARALRKTLTSIHKKTTFLVAEQRRAVEYSPAADPENDWHEFHEGLQSLLHQVQGLQQDLQLDGTNYHCCRSSANCSGHWPRGSGY
jgi:hypothetical protein